MEIEAGQIYEGKVTGIMKFGAFVDMGNGKSGLVHVSQVANAFVDDINNFLKVGDSVKVKVMSIAEDGKIALSVKACLPKPEPKEKSEEGKPVRKSRPKDITYTYQPKPTPPAPQNFEEMMARFKQNSDEKIGEFNRSREVRGGRRRK